MVIHWSLSDSKPPQVSGTLPSILAVFINAVVWIVSTRSPTSKYSRPFNNSFVTVPKAPVTIGIIVTFMFHGFFQFSSKVKVLISLFTFFHFYFVVRWDSKVENFYCFCWLLLGLVFWPRLWDPFVCQSPIGVYVCHSLGHIPFIRMVKFYHYYYYLLL